MNGFTRSLDRKIEASKRRQAEEQRGQRSQTPTQGLTDQASTANNNIPARKPTVTLPDFGAFEHGIRRMTESSSCAVTPSTSPTKNADGTHDALVLVGVLTEPIEVTPGRAALPVDQICTVPEAMDRLKLAMQQDPDYARTWHDNIAMAFKDGFRWDYDEHIGGVISDGMRDSIHRSANRAAEHLMEQAFGADTSAHAESVTEPAAGPAAPEDIMAMIQSINADDERRLAAWARNEHSRAFLGGKAWKVPIEPKAERVD